MDDPNDTNNSRTINMSLEATVVDKPKELSDKPKKASEAKNDSLPFLGKKQIVDDRISESRIPDTKMIENSVHIDRKELVDIQKAYEIIEEFAEGGLGKIKRAKDRVLERQVAIKSLKDDFLKEEAVVETFAEEAKLTAQLDHPAIIPFYGINTDSHNGLHLVMKFINGITLRNYIDQIVLNYKIDGIGKYDERAGLSSRLERFLRICEAISYAHSKKVVHRDLKPENIMLGDFGEVYVMDWGIALVLKDETGKKVKAAGTPAYIAPEVLNGEPYTLQSDVFSLGMILFELVTLKPGVRGENVSDILAYVKNGVLEKPEHRYSYHIPKDLKAVIQKAIAPDPRNRYGSVEELAEDVRAFLRFDEVTAHPDNPPRKLERWLFKHRVFTAFIGLAAMLLCLSVVIASLYQQNNLIKESRQREMILSGVQSVISHRAYAIDWIFLNLRNKLENFGGKVVYLLRHPGTEHAKIFSNKDFENSSSAPPGTVFSKLYGKNVNLDYPVYKPVSGSLAAADRSILDSLDESFVTDLKNAFFGSRPGALSAPPQILKQEALEKGFPMSWLYVGFNTGLFVSYPGKGGYPSDYDPRKRPWYALGLKGRTCQWGSPYLDINGLGIMLPGAFSLYDDLGNFYGVAGMDVSFDFIRKELMCSDEGGSIGYLIDEDGNVIVSSGNAADNIITDAAGNKTLNLRKFPDPQVLAVIKSGKSGFTEISRNGKDYIIVFAPVELLGWTYLEKYEKEKLLK